MAFQSDSQFVEFLCSAANTAVFCESAPAVNFLLEERLPTLREQAFLAVKPSTTPVGWNTSSWMQTFGNHYTDKVAMPKRLANGVSTFSFENQENQLQIESNQDVVRLESLLAMYQRNQGDFDSLQDLISDLRDLVLSRLPGQAAAINSDQISRLTSWLEIVNERRDARPAFAAPFGEVAHLLSGPDWAIQLRNVLGLSHLGGSPSKPLPVVMCRYNLSRVEQAARKASASAWAAIPTVLEAGGTSGPGAAFFPFPKAAASSNQFGSGVTVDLAPNGGLIFNAELLHFRLDYKLDDFVEVGEFTDVITDAQLAVARRRHFSLLEQDFMFRKDVP